MSVLYIYIYVYIYIYPYNYCIWIRRLNIASPVTGIIPGAGVKGPFWHHKGFMVMQAAGTREKKQPK